MIHPLDLAELLGGRVDDPGEAAETAQELLGDRLGIDLRDGEEQQKLQQFVVRQGIVRAGEKAVAQTLAVPPVVRAVGEDPPAEDCPPSPGWSDRAPVVPGLPAADRSRRISRLAGCRPNVPPIREAGGEADASRPLSNRESRRRSA